MAEWLLDDGTFPTVALIGQAVIVQLPDDSFEKFRRNRQVEGVVAARTVVPVEALQGLAKPFEGIGFVEIARNEIHAVHQLPPDLRSERSARV